jgi:excisionase family DNA binding protein
MYPYAWVHFYQDENVKDYTNENNEFFQTVLEVFMSNDIKGKLFDNSTWLTTKDVSEYLKVSCNQVRIMVSRGSLKAYKLLNRNRYRREDVEKLITSSSGYH